MSYFEKDAIISGLGISRIGRRTGIPGLELTLEAARAAIEDAGLTADDIDGIATFGDTPPAEVIEALGIQATRSDPRVRHRRCAHPRDVGLSRRVEKTGATRPGLPDRRDAGRVDDTSAPATSEPNPLASPPVEPRVPGTRRKLKPFEDIDELVAAHAYSAANWLAMHCRRHMELYGTTKEQLGWLAINSRRNAGLNPLAAYRDPMTMDDYLAARPVSTPFGLFDCDVPIDGSIALVVSHADYAADCPNPAVDVEAIGGAYGSGGWFHRDDFPKMASIEAAAEMWSRTDLTPSDVDVAELYDGFTFLTFAWLEALGFCADGEAGPFVDGATRIALDGALPLNTYGGQLSAGRMHGYWLLHEACLQLRGQAGERQLARRPEVAVAAAGGGPIAGCMLLTC